MLMGISGRFLNTPMGGSKVALVELSVAPAESWASFMVLVYLGTCFWEFPRAYSTNSRFGNKRVNNKPVAGRSDHG